FVSEEEFERLVQEGAFLEYVTHSWGPRHGTLRSEIERIRGEGRVPLLDLETHGALVVRDEVPGSITVFVKAPSLDELERQLGEGTFDDFPPPLVESRSKNYLTMALEEVAEGKLRYEYRS